MPANREGRRVIEGRALEAPVVENEAARLDQIDLDAETTGKTKQGPGILRYVGLVQGEAQTNSKSELSGARSHRDDSAITLATA